MFNHQPFLYRERPVIVRPYANHGRWIAECQCGSAGQLRPEQPRWRCEECGAGYRVLWTGLRVEIERLLHPRPVEHQNWHPGEPIANLAAENIEHGLAPEPL